MAAIDSVKNMARPLDYGFERDMVQLHGHPVAGIDEAGRGPWAGPVVAAAVILDAARIPVGITDSKQLTADRRETLYRRIMDSAEVGIGIADVARVDRENILQASLWAMAEAVSKLGTKPAFALVDGNKLPQLDCPATAIVKGDARCLSIAAASIIAKVTRDALMADLARSYPGYGFERHKGYGTPEHRDALDRLGVCDQHRRSFRPIQLKLGLS